MAFLSHAGFRMAAVYGRQFHKLLHNMDTHYVPALEAKAETDISELPSLCEQGGFWGTRHVCCGSLCAMQDCVVWLGACVCVWGGGRQKVGSKCCVTYGVAVHSTCHMLPTLDQ
jgi:hypothetical protein